MATVEQMPPVPLLGAGQCHLRLNGSCLKLTCIDRDGRRPCYCFYGFKLSLALALAKRFPVCCSYTRPLSFHFRRQEVMDKKLSEWMEKQRLGRRKGSTPIKKISLGLVQFLGTTPQRALVCIQFLSQLRCWTSPGQCGGRG